jgi:protoporphyrinogen oxidase
MLEEIKKHDYKYVIIGGGISGLAAARRLKKDLGENDFIVLEAQARIGGRVFTKTTEKGNRADLGASWVGIN